MIQVLPLRWSLVLRPRPADDAFRSSLSARKALARTKAKAKASVLGAGPTDQISDITGGTTRLLSGMHPQVEQNGAKTKFTKWTWDPEKMVPLNKCASGWTCFSLLWNLMKLDLKKWHELGHSIIMGFLHQQLGIQPETIREHRGNFKGNQEKLRPKKEIRAGFAYIRWSFPQRIGHNHGDFKQ